ncbi:MAG: glycosyltransferase [Deltaproteobacteria bacterium]|nr:glycosyltransferase [Deltaproteobacteria bacterium]
MMKPAAWKPVRKYLAQWAEPESGQILACLGEDRRYGHVLCIPAHGEGEGILQTLASVPKGPGGDVLIIVVVNDTNASPAWVRKANQDSLAALRGGTARATGPGTLMERHVHPRGDLLIIDRTHSGQPLPEGQGVGLARKIGADVALALWSADRIESPWIHCSDADVSFPANYFSRPLAAAGDPLLGKGPAAFVYDFRHVLEPDPEVACAALRYEIFLRYYVLGLRSAGSPYAFHTIGSTLAISPLAYAQARGFPKRRAAEDFHLLAKLAKLGPVDALRGEPILLSGRVSTRVPFGTGAGIARELERIQAGEFYPAYDPRIFTWLGVWLRTLGSLGSGNLSLRAYLSEHAAAAPAVAKVDATLLHDILEELGALGPAESGRGRGLRHLHERFDALRTLRFIHCLRDHHFPSVPLEEAIRTAAFLPRAALGEKRDLNSTCQTLARIEATNLV